MGRAKTNIRRNIFEKGIDVIQGWIDRPPVRGSWHPRKDWAKSAKAKKGAK